MTDPASPRIVCAAIRHRDGRIICGPRHFDHTMWRAILGLPEHEPLPSGDNPLIKGWASADDGFIDQFGNFYDRVIAWRIADACGQIYRDRDWQTGMLHSEHLY